MVLALLQHCHRGTRCCVIGAHAMTLQLGCEGCMSLLLARIARALCACYSGGFSAQQAWSSVSKPSTPQLAPYRWCCATAESQNSNTYCTGAHCLSSEHAAAAAPLQVGKKNRSVGATLMNQDSSRSHSIFTITIERLQQGTGEVSVTSAAFTNATIFYCGFGDLWHRQVPAAGQWRQVDQCSLGQAQQDVTMW